MTHKLDPEIVRELNLSSLVEGESATITFMCPNFLVRTLTVTIKGGKIIAQQACFEEDRTVKISGRTYRRSVTHEGEAVIITGTVYERDPSQLEIPRLLRRNIVGAGARLHYMIKGTTTTAVVREITVIKFAPTPNKISASSKLVAV